MARGFGTVRYDRSKNRWFVDVRPHGRIYSISGARIISEEMGIEVLAAIRRDIIEIGLSPEAAVAERLPNSGNTVGSYFEPYLLMYRRRVSKGERSPTSLRELERYARTHWSRLADYRLHTIAFGDLEDWLVWLTEEQGLSQKTAANVAGAFRAFLRWLKRRGEIRDVPEFPELAVRRPRPKTISIDEQEAVLAEIPEPKRGIFYALAELVIRPGEARALNVGDYDFAGGVMVVASAMKGDAHGAPRRGTKTGIAHQRQASERLMTWLDDHVPPLVRRNASVPLFRNPDGGEDQRWTHAALYGRWRTACSAAGVRAISLYNGTMHSTLSALRASGVPLEDLQEIRGHGSIETTRGYAPLDLARLQDQLRRR